MGKALSTLGFILLALYFFYLPFPSIFENSVYPAGILFYCLATAGCAFAAWGLILHASINVEIARNSILNASAIGFALLGLMRAGTAVFPHAPFETIRFIPAGEALLFGVLALWLARPAKLVSR